MLLIQSPDVEHNYQGHGKKKQRIANVVSSVQNMYIQGHFYKVLQQLI